VISYHEWNSPLASMTFGLPNPTFCFRLCVRLQEFLMSGRLIWSLNSCKVVLFKCLGCYRQMLSSRAINFVSAHAAPTARRSGVATAGGRGGKPWTFGFGSPATRTGSTRQGFNSRPISGNRRAPVPVYWSGLTGYRSEPVEFKFEFKLRRSTGSDRYTGRLDR